MHNRSDAEPSMWAEKEKGRIFPQSISGVINCPMPGTIISHYSILAENPEIPSCRLYQQWAKGACLCHIGCAPCCRPLHGHGCQRGQFQGHQRWVDGIANTRCFNRENHLHLNPHPATQHQAGQPPSPFPCCSVFVAYYCPRGITHAPQAPVMNLLCLPQALCCTCALHQLHSNCLQAKT